MANNRNNNPFRYNLRGTPTLPQIIAAAHAAGQNAAILNAAVQRATGMPIINRSPLMGVPGRVMPGLMPGALPVPMAPQLGVPHMGLPGAMGMPIGGFMPIPVPMPIPTMIRSNIVNVSEKTIISNNQKVVSSTVEHKQAVSGMPNMPGTSNADQMTINRTQSIISLDVPKEESQPASSSRIEEKKDTDNENEETTRNRHEKGDSSKYEAKEESMLRYKDMGDSPLRESHPPLRSHSREREYRSRSRDRSPHRDERSYGRDVNHKSPRTDHYDRDRSYRQRDRNRYSPVEHHNLSPRKDRSPENLRSSTGEGSSYFKQTASDSDGYSDKMYRNSRDSSSNSNYFNEPRDSRNYWDDRHADPKELDANSYASSDNRDLSRGVPDRDNSGPTWRNYDNTRKEYFCGKDNLLYDGEGDITSAGETGMWGKPQPKGQFARVPAHDHEIEYNRRAASPRPRHPPDDGYEEYTRSPIKDVRHQIYIDNLPPGTRAVHVKDLVQPHAPVVHCYVASNMKHSGFYSIVTLENERDVGYCIEELDQCQFRGSMLIVTRNFTKESLEHRD